MTATAADPSAGFGTSRYRTYVLSALTLIYILNFVDRGLLAVVGPDLVPELGLSDTQFGLPHRFRVCPALHDRGNSPRSVR